MEQDIYLMEKSSDMIEHYLIMELKMVTLLNVQEYLVLVILIEKSKILIYVQMVVKDIFRMNIKIAMNV